MKKIEPDFLGQRVRKSFIGEEIRHEAEAGLSFGETVIFDFNKVGATSPSFIDELIGVLFAHYGTII